jgi:flagellar basal body rod protein FlgC
MGIIETASKAVSAAEERLAVSARNVAGAGLSLQDGTAEEPDLVREAAVRVEASGAVEANLAVIRTARDMDKHLIDIFI